MNHPYHGFIQYIEDHAGDLVDVYLRDQEAAWELEAIDLIIETPATVFIGGKIYETHEHILINLEHIASLIFTGTDADDDDGRDDVPVPEKKKQIMSAILKVVNQ